jgi:hypothetical protein
MIKKITESLHNHKMYDLKKYYRKIKLHFQKETDKIKTEYQEMRVKDAEAILKRAEETITKNKKISEAEKDFEVSAERSTWEIRDQKKQAEIERLTKIIQDNQEKYDAIRRYEVDLQDLANEMTDKMKRATKKQSEVVGMIDGVAHSVKRYDQLQNKKDQIKIEEEV